MSRLFAYASVAAALFIPVGTLSADDWPQWMGPTRDDVWHESGILKEFPKDGPKILWRAPISGGYSGPAVAQGKVYVTDFLAEGDKSNDPGKKSELKGQERILCFSENDGKLLWKYEYPCEYKISYPAGPRTTPAVNEGKVYSLGAEGNLVCLDAAAGKLIWEKDLKKEYNIQAPHWGFSGHPLVEGDKLFALVGGEGSVAVAFDKNTGKEIWRALSASEPGYAPPTLIEAGGTKQLIQWSAEAINSLDPSTGKVYWSVPLKPDYGMSIMAPRQQGNYLFASGIGDQSLLLELDANKPNAKELWRGTNKMAVYCVNSTPVVDGETMYGVDRMGQLRGVTLATGKRLWETLKPTTGSRPANSGTAFLTKNGDQYFIFSETGDLIIAKLTPEGYTEVSRAHVVDQTNEAFGREVVWSHPAYAAKKAFIRNDKEIVAVSLAE
jgi:outer membrane protein assembly factor BamB